MIFLGKNMFSKIRIFNNSFNKTNINIDKGKSESSNQYESDFNIGTLVYHKLGEYREGKMRIEKIENGIAEVSIRFGILGPEKYTDPIFEKYPIDELSKL